METRKKYKIVLSKKYVRKSENGKEWFQFPVNVSGQLVAIQTIIPLDPYTEPDLKQVNAEKDKIYDEARTRGYEEGKARGQQEGLADAWEAARKIILSDGDGGLDIVAYREIFGYGKGVGTVLKTFTASEAIEKIRQYEQEKEEQIQVGDEVIPRETEYDTMIVTRLWKDDYDSDCIDAIGFDGRISSFLVSRVSKTGKHCKIAEVLQKMKEADNG